MDRLTTNKDVSEMSMCELAHNSCYAKEGWARYRDYEMDIDARDLARDLLKRYADGDDAFTDDEYFGEYMNDALQYGMNDIEGRIALFYRNLWAMADLRERLKYYEDLEEQGKLLKLPCAVGNTVYTNYAMQGWHLKKKDRPYEVKVVFIGINGVDNCMHVAFDNGCMIQCWFSDIGKTIFLTREEAEAALKELERGKGE
ncbi:MAG: hypothetical protein K1W20_04940 [Lachnospiraceae bacterium]